MLKAPPLRMGWIALVRDARLRRFHAGAHHEMNDPLDLLFVSSYPASPPTFGGQRRQEGLMRSLAKRNRISFIGLSPPSFDRELAERAMRAYCDEVVLVPWPEAEGLPKRLAQLRSLASLSSYERRYTNTPALQRALERLLLSRRFDLISVESPFQAYSKLRLAPAAERLPRVVIDAHNIEFDLARQYGDKSSGLVRKLHHAANWRKLEREEIAAWRAVDGVAFCSTDDDERAKALVPSIHSSVVPNGVDTEVFRPRADLPTPDGRTIVFFGTMNYFPNIDAIRWFLRDIWPILSKRNPHVRVKIIGSHPLPDVLAQRGPRVEVTGLVDDLQRHLAEAAAIIVPLRIGGGTRLKILESLAMGKAIVSTRLGAEGIAARSGEQIFIADQPDEFAAAVDLLLEDPALARRVGSAGRALVEQQYSWDAIGERMEEFMGRVIAGVPAGSGARPSASGLGLTAS